MKRKIQETTRVTRQSPATLRFAVLSKDISMPRASPKKQKRQERSCRLKNDAIHQEDYGLFQYAVQERLFDSKFDQAPERQYVASLTPEEFTLDRLLSQGLTRPLIFREGNPDGMRIPVNLTVEMVASAVGEDEKVEVLDSATQEGIQLTMGQFAQYYSAEKKNLSLRAQTQCKIYNLIDLEVSHTPLSALIDAPLLVRQIDWATNVWPTKLSVAKGFRIGKTETIPKTQKYVLLSKAGSYTDFHIDFGGSSVWYRIVRGQKVFLLVPPTEKNRQIYAQWVLFGQYSQFLGDLVDECERVLLAEGQTLIIPSGWIHAVFTLEDSIVIGGNFLHSFSGAMQLDVAILEDSLKVAKKIRYPFFHDLLWLVVQRYVAVWTNSRRAVSPFEQASLLVIVEFLSKNMASPNYTMYTPVADQHVPDQSGLLKTAQGILAVMSAKTLQTGEPLTFSMSPTLQQPSGDSVKKRCTTKEKPLPAAATRSCSTQTDESACCCPVHPLLTF